ncbi:hypothetical protein EUX98_g7082 [Antrodiella citrinella]|uniref:Uncharacterized protein n=1 Tax=Antrodiella citrinella TaxID=2447956 RepID=A0A4S4MN89_9APHY|nr:hypothetical protein EUX98_g7082 [Antrodiella citrinella]
MVSTLLRLLAASTLVIPALVGVGATPSSTVPGPVHPKINPQSFVALPARKRHVLPSTPETNAQRMKRGLGPKRPNFGRHKRALLPRQSSTPCASPTGYIEVDYVDDAGATIDGYLGATANDYGEYPFVESRDNALKVQLNNCASNGSPFDISTLNGIANEPYLGFIDGFSNESPVLSPGSYNYVYIGGTSQTPSGSPPLVQSNSFTDATELAEAVESAVWELGSDGRLTSAWVNPDNSIPAEVLLYVPSAGTFTVTADRQAFRDTFGPAFPVIFKFISA